MKRYDLIKIGKLNVIMLLNKECFDRFVNFFLADIFIFLMENIVTKTDYKF